MKYKYSTKSFKTNDVIELPDNSIILSSYFTTSSRDDGLYEVNITIRYLQSIN